MIERRSAIDLMFRGVCKFYNDGRQPVIRFTRAKASAAKLPS